MTKSPNPHNTLSPAATPDQLASALSANPEWADSGTSVDWIQTHISHVFVVGDRVFKLRKATRMPFLDFSTRAERNADCLREVALNRRLSPDVYLGISPIHFDGRTARVGPVSEDPLDPGSEHVVVMCRLPEGNDALSLLTRDALTTDALESVAERLATFHETVTLGQPAPWSPEAWRSRIVTPVLESLGAVADSGSISQDRIRTMEIVLESSTQRLSPSFEARRLVGKAVDGHGDLHLDHIWFEGNGSVPWMIDCLEFNQDLRQVDAASEVAFLAMDLCYRGRPDLADAFLGAYALRMDDYDLFSVVDFFAAYRALVRAKVASIAAGQSSIGEAQRKRAHTSVEKHFELAESLLKPKDSGGLILLCGTVGSGKSTVARSLGRSGKGIPISSDRVRKRLAGLPATAHPTSGTDAGLYTLDRTEDVYRGLLERAVPIVESGRSAILDASFSRRAQRDLVRAWAAARGLPTRLVEVHCGPQTALERVARREAAGTDASDAGPDFLAISQARFEPPDEWPAADREVRSTD